MDELEAFLDDPSGAKALAKSPKKEPYIEDELSELINHPHTYIRRRVRQQVEDGLWLHDLNMFYSYLNDRENLRTATKNRCVVCTLPMGSCEHSLSWDKSPVVPDESIGIRKIIVEDEDTRDATTKELDDVLGMLGDDGQGVEINTIQQIDDVHIDDLRWTLMLPRLSDKIGDTYIALSVPSERGWHACVTIGNFMVVHGGLRYQKHMVPQPFIGAVRYDDVEFLSDMYVYDISNQSWHTPEPDSKPSGRYGHVLATLDNKRLLMYGGRGARGRLLSDTWVYYMFEGRWEPIHVDQSRPPPSPRIFSSCVSVESISTIHPSLDGSKYNDVYLFGGTDGAENYGDLWIFRGHPKDMRWERSVGVGPPPSPRYGHQFIKVSERTLAVLGGCCVSPESELGAFTSNNHLENKELLNLCHELNECYAKEGATLGIGAQALKIALETAATSKAVGSGVEGEEIKLILRQAAGVATTIQLLENRTRNIENTLIDTFYEMKARQRMHVMTAKHPNPHLDITFLDHRDLTWKVQQYPPIVGKAPASRMHFGSVAIGSYVLLVGGTKPTSIGFVPIDQPATQVYALDMKSMRWLHCKPLDTTEHLENPIAAAERDINRAIKQCEESKMRGLSLGAKRGVTVDLLQAEKVLEVCRWRKRVLIRERDALKKPPASRWGISMTKIGQRGIMIGGWCSHNVVARDDIFSLDIEDELERRRRMETEFRSKLERERSIEERHALQLEIQSAYELRAIIAAERALEAREREMMAVEEIRSALPPLSIPPIVQLVKCNDRSMWVEWDRIKKDANNYILKDLNSITYILYGRGGFIPIREGDRVIVKCLQVILEKKVIGDGSDSDSDSDSSASSDFTPSVNSTITKLTNNTLGVDIDPSAFKNTQIEYDPEKHRIVDSHGEIIRTFVDGRFNVAYDDGSFEDFIDRSRIRVETEDEPAPFTPLPSVLKKSEIRRKIREKGKMKRESEEVDDDKNGYGNKNNMNNQTDSKEEHEVDPELNQKMSDLGDVDGTMLKIREAKRRREKKEAEKKAEEEVAQFKPTVNAGPGWRLLYVGKDNYYACTGIVPDDILMREPERIVSMEFCLQTEGADFPRGERSQLGESALFWTTRNQNRERSENPMQLSRAKKTMIEAVLSDKSSVMLQKLNNFVSVEGGAPHYL